MLLTEERISQRLAARLDQPLEDPYPPGYVTGERKPAAVLIPFARVNGAWELVYIRRAHNENDIHSGQVAFPGGRHEEGDADSVATALREAHEEIGLVPRDVTVLGRMHEFLSVGSHRVTPVIGVIPWPYEFRLQQEEVARVFTIPYDWLAQRENHELRPREGPHDGKKFPVVYFRKYDNELLWGATGRITVSLIETLVSS